MFALQVHRSRTLAGPPDSWEPLGNPTHNGTSFSSQSTYILPITQSACTGTATSAIARGARGARTRDCTPRFVYVADRFVPYVKDVVAPRYVWLPITMDTSAGNLSVVWQSEWTLPLLGTL